MLRMTLTPPDYHVRGAEVELTSPELPLSALRGERSNFTARSAFAAGREPSVHNRRNAEDTIVRTLRTIRPGLSPAVLAQSLMPHIEHLDQYSADETDSFASYLLLHAPNNFRPAETGKVDYEPFMQDRHPLAGGETMSSTIIQSLQNMRLRDQEIIHDQSTANRHRTVSSILAAVTVPMATAGTSLFAYGRITAARFSEHSSAANTSASFVELMGAATALPLVPAALCSAGNFLYLSWKIHYALRRIATISAVEHNLAALVRDAELHRTASAAHLNSAAASSL